MDDMKKAARLRHLSLFTNNLAPPTSEVARLLTTVVEGDFHGSWGLERGRQKSQLGGQELGRRMNNQDIKVLLVADNSRDAKLIQDMLVKAGGNRFHLDCVSRLQAELEQLAQRGIDVVLLDLPLSDGRGLDTFAKLHAQAPNVPIIVLTSLKDEALATEAVWESAQGYLVKEQIDGNLLVRSLHHAIERQRLMTDLKQRAEEILRTSELRLRNIIATVADGIVIVDRNGIVRFVNPAAQALLGRKTEDLVGESFGFPIAGETTELNIIHRDGETAIAEMRVVKIEWAGEIAYLASLRDITERKQTEEKIKQAAEEWRATFDSIVDLVSIHDKDFKLVRVNKAYADAFKMKPSELIGKTCYEVFHGTKEPPPNCPHKQTLETKEPHTAEFFEPHLGVHFEFSTSPIFNEKGEVTSSVHNAKDITERKKMEEQLIITDRLASIGGLISGVAHELNNPLTSIIGFSQLLLDRDTADDIKSDLEVVCSEAQRAAEIVKNLLTFARKHTPIRQLTNINSTIENVLKLRAYEQRVNNIQVNTHFDPQLPESMVDYFQMQQVFLNIIINAEYFMIEAHDRGALTITTEKVGDIIRASFADDGQGIFKENLGHLFDPFFTTKEVGKGTGLGLSICHGIITEHGGHIYAESDLVKGATFVVELPINSLNEEGAVK